MSKIGSNAESLMKNFLGFLIKDEEKDVEFLAKTIGVPKETMEALLKRLIDEKFVQKKGDNYILTDAIRKKYN